MESWTGELVIRTTGREVVTVGTRMESWTGEVVIRTTGREVVTVGTRMESWTGELVSRTTGKEQRVAVVALLLFQHGNAGAWWWSQKRSATGRGGGVVAVVNTKPRGSVEWGRPVVAMAVFYVVLLKTVNVYG
jgi:hypothetical protein